MLEKVDFSKESMGKDEYKQRHDELVKKLVVDQQHLHDSGRGLVVLFEGFDGAGKGSRISDLMYNLDARSASVFVPSDVDAADIRDFVGRKSGVSGFFPFMQQYWEALGQRGTITFYDRGWYAEAVQALIARQDEPAKPTRAVSIEASIHDFEELLSDNGYVVVKFFLHVRKKAQKERLTALHDDPATRWRVPDKKLASAKDYDPEYALYDSLLEQSNFDFAPWTLVNGEDKRSANILIAQTLIDAIDRALADANAAADDAGNEAASAAADAVAADAANADSAAEADRAAAFAEQASLQHAASPKHSRFPVEAGYPHLDAISHDLVCGAGEYKKELNRLQEELFRLENAMYLARVPLMIVYEGWDAAGKGGNIKRVAQALDARSYTIFPSPAPTPVELAHPHLWRYWTRLPKAGHVGIYDRSWYGRVLVERVEGLASEDEWSRAYDEINAFERDMVEWGALLIKFWVNIGFDTQLERFNARAADPARQWKITDEDYRNREKNPLYEVAIDDMFRLTSTTFAPWIVLESDDKHYARIKALQIIVDALKERLG